MPQLQADADVIEKVLVGVRFAHGASLVSTSIIYDLRKGERMVLRVGWAYQYGAFVRASRYPRYCVAGRSRSELAE